MLSLMTCYDVINENHPQPYYRKKNEKSTVSKTYSNERLLGRQPS